MNRFSKLILAGVFFALTGSAAMAFPPPPYKPTQYPPIKYFPSTPKYVTPIYPKPISPVVVFPNTQYFRPFVPVSTFVPVRHQYTVYYRFGAYDPWIRHTTSYDYFHVAEIRDRFLYTFGYDAIVY